MSIIRLKSKQGTESQAVEKDTNPVGEETKVTSAGGKWGNPAILKEFTERADALSRHFKMNNGTAKSIYSASPVNYFDDISQSWKAIDNTLAEKADTYEANGGNFKTEIYKPNVGKKLRMSSDGVSVSWEYLGKVSTNPTVSAMNAAEEGAATELCVKEAATGNLQSVDGAAVYENADKDTDIEYVVQGNGVKENIIIKERAEEYRYLFALNTEGLNLRLSEDNASLELYSEVTGEDGSVQEKTEATIPAPFMYDANGENSDDVYFELEPEADGKYIFAVIASADWINAENRAFPVTIDPQIVTEGANAVSKQVQSRFRYSSSGGSGSGYSAWSTVTSNYIKVSRTSSQEYRTVLTINKNNIKTLDQKISSVQLILTPYKVTQSGYCSIGGISTNITGTKVRANITSRFNSGSGNFTVNVEPYSARNVNAEFYASGANGPLIEVEYLLEGQKKRTVQQFTLAGGLVGQYDVATGDMAIAFEDVPASDSVLGVGISHVYKKSAEDFRVGKDFRLSLNETLVKNIDAALDAEYVYTDQYGMKYGFKDTYYYINKSGKKTSVSKSLVTVDLDGKLTYTTGGKTYEVKKEQRTSSGLTVTTKYEGFKGAEWLEQRSDEQKQLEQQKKSYFDALKQFVIAEADSGEIRYSSTDYLPNDFSKFMAFVSGGENILLTESEALNLQSLILQRDSLGIQTESIEHQQESLDHSKEALYYQYQTMCNTKELDSNAESAKSTYENVDTQNKYNQKTKENLWQQYLDVNTSKADLTKSSLQYQDQNDLIDLQINVLHEKSSEYVEQVREYYKEYLNLDDQARRFNRQLPVSYLTDGEIIKGFNEAGWLVAILDNYENVMTVEYDEAGKILSVYDGEDKQIAFEYRPDGLLGSITDTRGRRTVYDYLGTVLNKVLRPDGTVYAITLTGDEFTEVKVYEKQQKNSKPIGIGTVSKSGNVTTVTNKTGVSSIENGKIDYLDSSAWKTLNTLKITFGSGLTTVSEPESGKNTYYGITDEDKVNAYYAEENGKVTAAELYDYAAYDRDNTQRAKRSSLYTKPYSSFSGEDFVGGDFVNTELDEFNNPATKTTNARALSDGTTQQATVTYEYDDNHKCIKETAVVTIKEGTSVLKTYTQITAYNYNASGKAVRKESYIEGEELTTGKSVEETVYDEKGNAVKSFSYNSLDSSSKFYTESEVAENGQTLADYDETGENKTEYEYIAGTNVVRSQKLPNGSKFAYGHDESDTVTSITQSTEEGEENSTHTRYTCGEVTELVSGNNVVRYAYDAKRRVTQVCLNDLETVYIQNSYTDDTTQEGITGTVDACASKNTNGETITSYTDKQGKLRRITMPSGANIDYAYNAKGETTSITDGVSGKTESYTYNDIYDRLTSYARGTEYTEAYAYDKYGKVSSVTQSGAASRTYTYAYRSNAARELESISTGAYKFSPQTDKLGRNAGREIWKDNARLAAEYIYYRKAGDHATNMPISVYFGKKKGDILSISESVKYKYDRMGNICRIDENGEPVVWYKYDALNRLIREDNKTFKKTWLYSYDNKGNILCKRETAFTLKENVEECEFTNVQYEYDGDKLLSFGTEACEYDDIGNPKKYREKNVTWSNGRQMTSYDGTAFTYDGLGRRLNKGNITYTYDSNGRVIKQSNGIEFIYDNTGVAGIVYNDATYVYRKDAQGNIVALIDSSGNVVVEYKYDAWGDHVIVLSDSSNENLAKANPFRYRGYYYDEETGLYYLKSRYYDPEVGRFITIDDISYLDPETINGLNLYAYCGNNPVMRVDANGNAWWHWLLGALAVVFVSVITAGAAAAFAGLALGITGATLTSIGVHALVGGLVVGGINLASQAYSVGIENVNYWTLAISTIGGALSGAIGGSTAGLGMQLASNALIGMAQYTLTTTIEKEPFSIRMMFAMGIFSIIGITSGGAMTPGSSLAIAAFRKEFYKASKFFAKEFYKALGKQSLLSTISGSFWGWLGDWFQNIVGV